MDAEDATVCSFCGMPHLMYKDMHEKDKRIAALEKQCAEAKQEQLGVDDLAEAVAAAKKRGEASTSAHYEQLQQMQESCAKKLSGLTAVEKKLAAATSELNVLHKTASETAEALATEQRLRSEQVSRALAEAKAAAAREAALTDRVEAAEASSCGADNSSRVMRGQLRQLQAELAASAEAVQAERAKVRAAELLQRSVLAFAVQASSSLRNELGDMKAAVRVSQSEAAAAATAAAMGAAAAAEMETERWEGAAATMGSELASSRAAVAAAAAEAAAAAAAAADARAAHEQEVAQAGETKAGLESALEKESARATVAEADAAAARHEAEVLVTTVRAEAAEAAARDRSKLEKRSEELNGLRAAVEQASQRAGRCRARAAFKVPSPSYLLFRAASACLTPAYLIWQMRGQLHAAGSERELSERELGRARAAVAAAEAAAAEARATADTTGAEAETMAGRAREADARASEADERAGAAAAELAAAKREHALNREEAVRMVTTVTANAKGDASAAASAADAARAAIARETLLQAHATETP